MLIKKLVDAHETGRQPARESDVTYAQSVHKVDEGRSCRYMAMTTELLVTPGGRSSPTRAKSAASVVTRVGCVPLVGGADLYTKCNTPPQEEGEP
jgi:hypothetical protein